MLCEKCKKNTATFHYTEVVNGVKNEHHLCAECAANTDVSYYSSIFDNDMNLTQLLSGILGGRSLFADSGKEDPARQVQCPKCHTTYGEFVANSSFGCSECYEVFGPLISDTIKKLQGSDRHVGKKPMLYGMQDKRDENAGAVAEETAQADARKEIDFLSKKLKEAVADEDFAEAAKLRDLIAGLRGKEENNV